MLVAATLAAAGAGGASLVAQQTAPPASDLEVVQIRPNFYVIVGDGSNIAVQLGTDGIVIVDTGTGEKAKQVIAEIRKLSTRPIRYVINTSADPRSRRRQRRAVGGGAVGDPDRRSQRDRRRRRPRADPGRGERAVEDDRARG